MRRALSMLLMALCVVCPLGLCLAQEAVDPNEPPLTAAQTEMEKSLLSRMPSAAAMQEQLQALRDEHIVAQFEAGLRALRVGYAKGNRSYLRISANRFRDVTRLAPNLALGHFNLGLAHFYLDELGFAQAAFAEAIRLDKAMRDLVPLLWWENFQQLPDRARLAGGAAKEPNPWFWQILPEAGLHYINQSQTGLIVWQPQITPEHYVLNSRATVRFRCANGGRLSIGCRQPSGGAVIFVIGATAASLSYFPTPTEGQEIAVAPMRLLQGWHIAELDVYGTSVQAYVDGETIFNKTVPSAGPGISSFTLWGPGEVILDWILVTRN